MLAFNLPAAAEKTGHILAALGLPEAQAVQDVFGSTHDYCASLGIEMRLSKLGVPQDDLETMADDAFAIRRLLDNNPRDLTRQDILSIYETAF